VVRSDHATQNRAICFPPPSVIYAFRGRGFDLLFVDHLDSA
jgi:hypothetical protein